MNGIGTAFIWAAIACGPIFLAVLGILAGQTAIVRARAAAQSKRRG